MPGTTPDLVQALKDRAAARAAAQDLANDQRMAAIQAAKPGSGREIECEHTLAPASIAGYTRDLPPDAGAVSVAPGLAAEEEEEEDEEEGTSGREEEETLGVPVVIINKTKSGGSPSQPRDDAAFHSVPSSATKPRAGAAAAAAPSQGYPTYAPYTMPAPLTRMSPAPHPALNPSYYSYPYPYPYPPPPPPPPFAPPFDPYLGYAPWPT